jgi:hypothetical protein
MENSGWVKLYRKFIESKIFKNSSLLQTFIYCLLIADHKEHWTSIKTGRGQTEVLIKPGQFIFGRNAAAKKMKKPPTTIYAQMLKLRDFGMIDLKPDTHFSVGTIVNWDFYQGQKNFFDTHSTTNRHTQEWLRNNSSRRKKSKAASFAPESFPVTDKMRAFAKKTGFTGNLEWETERFLDWHRSKKNRFKDWTAAWRNWIRKAVEIQKETSTQEPPEMIDTEKIYEN